MLIASQPRRGLIAVRAEPSATVTAAKSSLTVEHQLRWFDPRASDLREPMRNTVLERHQCQDALRVAVVACTSAIHPLLAFIIGHDTAHNFLLKRRCCRFAQDIGITSDPRITCPCLLKTVPARSGCARCWFQNGDGITPLKPPSTRSRDVPSLLFSVRVPIKPRRARRTVVAPPLAISSIGAFRTPAVGACG